jgi:hypothetical protein
MRCKDPLPCGIGALARYLVEFMHENNLPDPKEDAAAW